MIETQKFTFWNCCLLRYLSASHVEYSRECIRREVIAKDITLSILYLKVVCKDVR